MGNNISFDEIDNPKCLKQCTKEERKNFTENGICNKVLSVKDGLPIRCVGNWAYQKLHLLNQYFGIFTVGMKNKWKLNYIEICSGPGRCIDRQEGMEFNGSSLCIIKHKAYEFIDHALFFDFDQNVVKTLNTRIKNLQVPNAVCFNGDYFNSESICRRIREHITPKSLNLIFIDPTDCSVPFKLIKDIKTVIPNSDFIINIASGTDLNRNIVNSILEPKAYAKSKLKYSRFLYGTDFFNDEKNIELAKRNNNLGLRDSFRTYYQESMRAIGYQHFRLHRIRHFYDILFATQNLKGLEFWDKATSINFDGQRSLF